MDAPPEVRYTQTSDGVNIAYTVTGEGPALVSLTMAFASHIQLDWAIPEARSWYERLGAGRTLVRLEQRGTGMSEGRLDPSIDASLRDVEAVVNLLDREPVALFGFLGAAPVAIAFAARHPDRVSALVLANALAGTDPTQLPVISALYSLGEGDRKLYLETLARTMVGTSSPELVSSYAARLEEHFKPEIFREYNRMRLEGRVALDVTDALAHVACPTLVLHRRDFPNIPVSQGRELASRIADARLVVLEGDAGLPWAGDGDAALDAINSFLREGSGEQAGDPFDRALQTILFTDLESSTALTQRVGDEAAQEVLRGHNTAVRRALDEHGGREVKHTGDGIMASFPSAVAAVTAALQIQRDLAGGEVRVRIGLNAGEPIAEDDDLFGTAVQLAARIVDRAEPGQVLVSNVVRELCAGKTFEFTSVGEATLKGFDKPVTLFEVRA